MLSNIILFEWKFNVLFPFKIPMLKMFKLLLHCKKYENIIYIKIIKMSFETNFKQPLTNLTSFSFVFDNSFFKKPQFLQCLLKITKQWCHDSTILQFLEFHKITWNLTIFEIPGKVYLFFTLDKKRQKSYLLFQ